MLPCPRRQESGLAISPPESDHWRDLGTCSYCGSMNPEEFLRRAANGVKLGPTDKNYKVYVGEHHEKFYFQHLSENQMLEFIKLFNEQKLNVGVPGYFYVLPFFMKVE